MKVYFPFLEMFRKPMLTGVKTWTSRTKKYGEAGDTFEAFGRTFRIDDVFKNRLGNVASLYYDREGVGSKQEFVELWKKIHPRKGFEPGQLVWVHQFSLMNLCPCCGFDLSSEANGLCKDCALHCTGSLLKDKPRVTCWIEQNRRFGHEKSVQKHG
jgi:hypothetical protein